MPKTPKLLVVTRISPIPGEQGSAAYLLDILNFLAKKGFHIRICWTGHNDFMIKHGWYIIPATFTKVFKLIIPGQLAIGRLRILPRKWLLPLKARLLYRLKKLLTGLGLFSSVQKIRKRSNTEGSVPPSPAPTWNEPPTQAEIRFIQKTIQKFQPDVIIANYIWMNAALEGISNTPAALRVVLAPDINHQMFRLRNGKIEVVSMENENSREQEEKWTADCDLIVSITEEDASVFREMHRDKDVLVAPKASCVGKIENKPVAGRCLFVGSLAFFNESALQWLLDEIWPRVREAAPSATLHVCGSVCRTFNGSWEGVTFRGLVDTLETEYAEAEVVVLPLLEGRGLKTKLVEACSYGKACVTTSIGLPGLGFLKKGVILADNPLDFADAIIHLFEDETHRRRVETEGRRLVAANLSPEACFDPLHKRLVKHLQNRAADCADG